MAFFNADPDRYLLVEYLGGAEGLPQLDLLQRHLLHTRVQLRHLGKQ